VICSKSYEEALYVQQLSQKVKNSKVL